MSNIYKCPGPLPRVGVPGDPDLGADRATALRLVPRHVQSRGGVLLSNKNSAQKLILYLLFMGDLLKCSLCALIFKTTFCANKRFRFGWT